MGREWLSGEGEEALRGFGTHLLYVDSYGRGVFSHTASLSEVLGLGKHIQPSRSRALRGIMGRMVVEHARLLADDNLPATEGGVPEPLNRDELSSRYYEAGQFLVTDHILQGETGLRPSAMRAYCNALRSIIGVHGELCVLKNQPITEALPWEAALDAADEYRGSVLQPMLDIVGLEASLLLPPDVNS